MSDTDLIGLTADIVAAHVSHNSVGAGDVPVLIRAVHDALARAGEPAPAEAAAKQEPAVPVRQSVRQDHIVCLEDGKKLKMLKRYLRSNYDMSPDEYRAKWGLPRDYPMVAPAYAEQRRGLAHKIGLGRKKVVEEAGAVVASVAHAAEAVVDAVKPGRKPRGIKAAKAAAQSHLGAPESEQNEG
ncbi:MucR family transcriptional regulator [Sphingomonas sp.]|uniref:MucR family transcriptional regulator n=1 Tax=Sphingomonas sp. TaxID=28214 RepID=UPI003B008064